MNTHPTPHIRANQQYQLVLYDRLDAAVQAELSDLSAEPGFYGILEPNDPESGLPVKAVDTDTALLFLTLQQAGPVPHYVTVSLGARSRQLIADLVLNNVLEIATPDGSHWVSGVQAHTVLQPGRATGSATNHTITQLSEAAVRYGQLLAADQLAVNELAQRLYAYNAIPISAEWRRQLPDTNAVEAFLGIDARAMQPHFDRIQSAEPNGWITFRAHHNRPMPQRLGYKLYVSPQPRHLPAIWPQLVAIFAQHDVHAFKVGGTVQGLLRPDKLVAYLPSLTALHALADTLQAELAHVPAQGVPFTAPIDAAGLLSWGMDPPNAANDVVWHGRQSWRLWIAGQLATALVAAQHADIAVEPWRFALDKLTLLGVATATWTPEQTLWQQHGEQ
ncbi:MAG: hypothetical protein M9918_11090 [Anaerolineae bacterium]|nr:hypothetical protein [Anaerolineae bacterium]